MARSRLQIGKYVNLGFKVMGGLVAASPAFAAFNTTKSDLSQFPHQVLYNYTGVDSYSGNFNTTQLVAGIGSVGGGIFLAWVGKHVSRFFR